MYACPHDDVCVLVQLDAASIPYTRALQLPGEFVLTYPKSFHQGFNLGETLLR